MCLPGLVMRGLRPPDVRGVSPEPSGRGFRRDRGSATSLRLWSLMSWHPYPCPFHLYQASHIRGTLLSDLTDQTKQRRVADNHSLFLPHMGLLACWACKRRPLASPTHSTVMSLGCGPPEQLPKPPGLSRWRQKGNIRFLIPALLCDLGQVPPISGLVFLHLDLDRKWDGLDNF